MKRTEKIDIKFHGHSVGTLSFTPDNRLNVFGDMVCHVWVMVFYNIAVVQMYDSNIIKFRDSMKWHAISSNP